MVSAAGNSGYPLLDVMWTVFIIFAWVIWFMLLFRVFGDLFGRNDISGWAKAGWTVFVLFLPYLGVLVYLIAEGRQMAERQVARLETNQAQYASYMRTTSPNGAGATTPTDEIAKAKLLLDDGSISQDEFNAIKQKALAA